MEISAEGQAFVFLLAVVLGGILSGVYDIFKILRIIMKLNKIRVFFLDIIYFLISSIITFLFMIAFTYGEIRFYIFFGEIVGFFVYKLTCGNFIVKFTLKIFKFLKRKVFPIFIIFNNIFTEFLIFLLKPFCKINNFFKKLLPDFKKILYNFCSQLCSGFLKRFGFKKRK